MSEYIAPDLLIVDWKRILSDPDRPKGGLWGDTIVASLIARIEAERTRADDLLAERGDWRASVMLFAGVDIGVVSIVL